MPTPDELFPDDDPAGWPMCDGVFQWVNPAERPAERLCPVCCPVCAAEVRGVWFGSPLERIRVSYHTAPSRFGLSEW